MPPKSENNWHPAEVVEQSAKKTPHLVLLQEYERQGHIIILIISPQLSIGLHQSLLADRFLDFLLRLASNTDA